MHSSENSWTQKIRGSGVLATENRSHVISNTTIHTLDLHNIGTFLIEKGLKNELTVSADDNLLPYVITEAVDGTLTCQLNSLTLRYPAPLQLK